MKSANAQISCGLSIAGSPKNLVETAPEPETVAAMPERIALLKARLLVEKGGFVKTGTPLYEDKENKDIVFPSPGAGKIKEIIYGPRRVISEIVIKLDDDETAETFTPYPLKKLSGLSPASIKEILLKGGIWPFIRDVVYKKTADPKQNPAAIWIASDNQDPFHPPAKTWLNNADDLLFFKTGHHALKILCSNVFFCKCADFPPLDPEAEKLVTHRISGGYPQEDPAVLHYYFKTKPDQNQAWFINGQDVRLLGEFLETGRFPVKRIVAVSGTGVEGRYVQTRIGAPLKILAQPADADRYRWVVGGLFRGYSSSPDSHLSLYETSLGLIEESGRREMLGFMRPGWSKPSCSRTFLSAFNPRPLPVDADMHGSKRACVNCGNCTRVCPVQILPQFTYKCILAGEIEEALSHGMLDCVECGLCSYVCPSKIELCQTFQKTKQDYLRQRI
jgi:Na+-transporting NADH:ubiquinone oxidoreductase subunit A